MAEDSETSGTADKPEKAKKGENAARTAAKAEPSFSRPTLPYVIAAIVASAAMAWYFFVFVPAKLDYFVGMRFRTLAVAGGHISSKIEGLATAVQNSVGAGSPDDCREDYGPSEADVYLAHVLPDIRLESPGSAGEPAVVVCGKSGSISWSSLVEQAAASSRRDFDDLILATGNGDVVWQRESSTPRLGNLSELLGAKDESEGWVFSWRAKATSPIAKDQKNLQTSAQLKPVNLGGRPSLLLVQAVRARGSITLPGQVAGAAEPMLFVAGLVVRDSLMRQAHRIPAAWLVPFGCAVVFLFLAIPFVKLATLTAKERFRFTDVLLMVVATVSAAGLGALLLSASAQSTAADDALGRFAERIETNLATETQRIGAFATFIHEHRDKIMPLECAAILHTVIHEGPTHVLNCKIWQALRDPSIASELRTVGLDPAFPSIDIDVVAWLDSTGAQVQKWTTKEQVTSRYSHAANQHFRDLTTGHLWTLDRLRVQGPFVGEEFTMEPLPSPTTSELAVAFAIRAKDPKLLRSQYLFLNVRPQSLVDALVPPGYGFAIVARDGKVLFHSDEGLSLQENLFEELGDARQARESVSERRVLTWSGDYHGRRHRLRMQPMGAFIGCPWSIVTFQESEPQLTAVVAQQSGTFRLGMVNLAVLAVVAGAFAWYSRSRHRRARDLMQMMLADPRSDSAARRVRFLLGVLAIEVALWLSTVEYPAVPIPLDLVYALFAVLPLVALLVTFLVRPWAGNDETPASGSGPVSTTLAESAGFRARLSTIMPRLELGLIVVAVGVLPTAGFTQVVRIVHQANATQQWLELAQDRWESRQLRLEQRLHGPNYAPETTSLLEWGLEARTFEPSRPYSYLTVLPGVAAGTVPPAPSGQRLLRWLLEWDVFSSTNQPLAWTAGAAPVPSDGPLAKMTVAPRVAAPISWPFVLAGSAIVTFALAAVYWARKKLLAHPAAAPSLRGVVEGVAGGDGVVVLLVGPPMSKKDAAVRDVVKDVTQQPVIHRLRLLHSQLTPELVETYVAQVNQAIDAAIQSADKPPFWKPPFWIHVSNLETQLVDPACRRTVFDLLQRLGEAPSEARRVVAVTSSVDPIAHFEEIFREERARIYSDPVPEVALSRSALLLSRVRRCYLPISDPKGRQRRCRAVWDQWWRYDPAEWRETLRAELDGLAPLQPIREELVALWKNRDEVPFEEIERTIRLRASAYYQLLWTTCTRNEKLVLIQLAQEGFVVEQSWDVVVPLIAKGIIVERPIPAIFNRTFRDFLLNIERDSVIQEWERGEGHGLWLVSGRLIGSSLVAGLLFFLLTQDVSVQSLLPVVSGTGVFSVPLVRSLIARFSSKSVAATA